MLWWAFLVALPFHSIYTHARRSRAVGLAGLSLLLFSMTLFSSSLVLPAQAQEDDARTLFQRGEVAYAQGDYEDAITMWTRAYELDPRPLLQWNLAQAYERLARLPEATNALETYLANADPSDVHQADARARLGAIRERIAATGITLRGGPEGASIAIDGDDHGRLPRPDAIAVTPGSHTVVVTATGYETFRATVSVPAGNALELEVTMAANAVASAGGGAPFPIIGVSLMGAGAAIVIAGAVMGGVALGDAGSAPSSTGPEADGARGLALGADITMGIGAACAVAGIVVTILEVSGGSSDESSAFQLVPYGDPSGGGLRASGRF